ncbi:putative serine/threonine-protein kinase [Prunus yedoensis var. nudiflora]|uniref:Putative serine/threonine-protein kinase n=1 Tax=Prunus yedoensis var. nudiflora TaxID=2094558 RepID=A0A314UA74_PRUYE|nr:putative serine/threonine-protein kinase [Prunus yedoensis var. nudiflora]
MEASSSNSSSKSGLVVANERRPSGGIRIENPFTLKVGQVFTGFGIGCGVGIGVGRPINLGAIPVLNQVMGATRGATDALSGVSRHVNNSLRKLGAKNIEAGIGCGVGIGHGFGVGMSCYVFPGNSIVPSYAMLGIPKHEEAPPTPQHPLSAMGDACSRMDLTAIHQILLMTHYKDDEGTNELSFQEWNQQMKDMLEAQKRGDLAFRDKDLRSAMDCHSQAGLALGELRKENNFLRILWPVTNPPSSQEHLLHPQLLQKPLCPFLARRYFDDVGV